MKALASMATSAVLFISATAQTITLFNDPNFAGPSIDFSVTLEKCQNLPVDFQQSVSSVKLGTLRCGLCYDPCREGDDLPQGPCATVTGDQPSLPPEADNIAVSIFCA